jgi:hypothetical protein
MMSSPKPATDVKVDVKISKETGGAYADIRQVIESELARIKQERANKDAHEGSNPDSHDNRNGNGIK